MPHNDGTMTADEHVTEAMRLVDYAEQLTPDVGVVRAVQGLTHAVLALVDEAQVRRALGL